MGAPMNPARTEMSGPQKEKDSRRFWLITIGIAALIAIIGLVFFLTH
jgi:hypothetical protein